MLQPGRRVLLVEEEEEAERWGIRALPNVLCVECICAVQEDDSP